MLAWIFSKPLVSISNTIFGSPDQPRPPPISLFGWRTPITLTRPCYYTRVGRKCLPTGNKCQISQQYCGSNKLCRSKQDQRAKTKLEFPLNRECLWLWLIFAMYFHWAELSSLSCIFYERSSHHCCICWIWFCLYLNLNSSKFPTQNFNSKWKDNLTLWITIQDWSSSIPRAGAMLPITSRTIELLINRAVIGARGVVHHD